MAARKVLDLHRPADLVLVADWQIIDWLLIPEHAAFSIQFARDEMVIAYTHSSHYAEEIGKDNWFEILLRGDVSYGYSDPRLDPAGYRTLFVWQLSELYYHRPGFYEELLAGGPLKNMRPMSVALIALLEAGELDYFLYRSVAMQQGLKFLELPSELNLSQLDLQDFYSKAIVKVTDHKRTLRIHGAPIVYGLTIPFSAQNPSMAVEFTKFLLSPEGQRILRDHGLFPIVPALVPIGWEHIPVELRELVVPRNKPCGSPG